MDESSASHICVCVRVFHFFMAPLFFVGRVPLFVGGLSRGLAGQPPFRGGGPLKKTYPPSNLHGT